MTFTSRQPRCRNSQIELVPLLEHTQIRFETYSGFTLLDRLSNEKVTPVAELHRRSISITSTSISSVPTPQKTPQTTTNRNYQTDRNEQ
jgi:hypothetical protein